MNSAATFVMKAWTGRIILNLPFLNFIQRIKIISFKAPFKRITIYEAIQEHTGFDVSNMNEEQLRSVCTQLNIHADKTMGKGKLVDEIFGGKCEDHYIQPT